MRSLLFVPGTRPDRITKALASGADAVCIDLEDAVAPDDKAPAREMVMQALAQPREPATRLGFRINPVRTANGLADLAAYGESNVAADFVMIPKAAHPVELEIVAGALEGPDRPHLWPIIESAKGLSRAYAIAAAPYVQGLLFGGADFAADLGTGMEWEPLFHARGSLAAAAAAAGVELLDVPHLDVNDDEGLAASTRRARAIGFTGRACIHPRQIAGVNAAFTPSEAEIEQARQVLAAFRQSQGGAALLDGKLIELPVIRAAERTLAAAGLKE
ncbi:MAG: citrate lyase subunit beta / citryl-CoA lyase [Oceanicaulis sp. HLUCCA04]|nr:MAG: citrate lyase subunit beta / citryl-CoA lyase [Oceanicaulis sp. HLUCCA04]